jgi:type I restriction enzyme S subunit
MAPEVVHVKGTPADCQGQPMIAGLKLLGSTPSFHVRAAWDVARLWTVARLRSETNRPDLALLSVFLGRGVIPYGEGGGQVHKPSVDVSGYQVAYPGDLVLNNQQAWRGSVGVSRHLGIISPAYLVLVLFDSLDPRFADYLFQSGVMVAQFVTSSKGVGDIQRDVHTPWLKNTQVPIPTREEQAAIVYFLDYMDRRIRNYIRAKQTLIALLNEQKQAIIHRAVIRGLNPDVRLKPSGVQWLGDVPEHWEVVPCRHLFRAVTRRDIRGDEVKLSVTQRAGLVPTAEMDENSTQASSFDRFQVCEPTDLVLNKYKAHLGVFWAAGCRGLITPNYTVFRPIRALSTTYFELVFHTRSYRDAFTMTVYGVTEGMSPLYTQDFYAIPAIFPPVAEQDRIVAAIANQTETENGAIRRVEREIFLLREYRTRLIADVVTGKLDVRDAAARLPDEAEEPEPADEAESLAENGEEVDDAEEAGEPEEVDSTP